MVKVSHILREDMSGQMDIKWYEDIFFKCKQAGQFISGISDLLIWNYVILFIAVQV